MLNLIDVDDIIHISETYSAEEALVIMNILLECKRVDAIPVSFIKQVLPQIDYRRLVRLWRAQNNETVVSSEPDCNICEHKFYCYGKDDKKVCEAFERRKDS